MQKRKSENKNLERLDLASGWSESNSQDKLKIEKWCTENSKSDFLVENDIYKLVEAWCTVQGKDIVLN